MDLPSWIFSARRLKVLNTQNSHYSDEIKKYIIELL